MWMDQEITRYHTVVSNEILLFEILMSKTIICKFHYKPKNTCSSPKIKETSQRHKIFELMTLEKKFTQYQLLTLLMASTGCRFYRTLLPRRRDIWQWPLARPAGGSAKTLMRRKAGLALLPLEASALRKRPTPAVKDWVSKAGGIMLVMVVGSKAL